MLRERLLEHVAQLFRFAALASNQDDFVAGGAFARSGQSYLESGYEFRLSATPHAATNLHGGYYL
jgi:hypothetical protein